MPDLSASPASPELPPSAAPRYRRAAVMLWLSWLAMLPGHLLFFFHLKQWLALALFVAALVCRQFVPFKSVAPTPLIRGFHEPIDAPAKIIVIAFAMFLALGFVSMVTLDVSWTGPAMFAPFALIFVLLVLRWILADLKGLREYRNKLRTAP